jgi:hypothetical protein
VSDQFSLLTKPLLLLGSQIGYEREVVLWSPPADGEPLAWQIPSASQVQRLFQWLGVPEVTACELKSFVERHLLLVPSAPCVPLSCAVLSKQRFDDLQTHMLRRGVTIFKIFKYRDIVEKTSPFDWLTVGMLLYVFEHLDR